MKFDKIKQKVERIIKVNMETAELKLPEAPVSGGSYTVVKHFGDDFLYVSGCGPVLEGQTWNGRLQETYTTQEGAAAAKNCILNMLAAVKAEIGDLTRIKSFVKLLVFVAGPAEYTKQSVVANGATDFLIEVFGTECGRPARSAVGVNSLPNNIPVEVEALIELKK